VTRPARGRSRERRDEVVSRLAALRLGKRFIDGRDVSPVGPMLDDAKAKGQTVVTLGKTLAGKAPLDRTPDETTKELTADETLVRLVRKS